MTTVTQGNSSSYTFTGADSIALTLAQGMKARVSVASAAGLQKYSDVVTETRSIGPFAAGDVLSVTADRGPVDYAVTPGFMTSVPVFEGSSSMVSIFDGNASKVRVYG